MRRRERRAVGAWRLQQQRSERLVVSLKPLPLLKARLQLERLRKVVRPLHLSAVVPVAVPVAVAARIGSASPSFIRGGRRRCAIHLETNTERGQRLLNDAHDLRSRNQSTAL